jgi:peptidoglycan/LPS O-acetylase OafA/YrhL
MNAIIDDARSEEVLQQIPADRLDYIDGLRGVACMSVLFFHIWLSARCPFPYWWNPLAAGYAGVNLFLVLSGFCLFWPMVKRGVVTREPTFAKFLLRRAKRILPPYYAAVMLCALASLIFPREIWPTVPPGGAQDVIKTLPWHLLMVHNLNDHHIMLLDGPLWSIGLEWDLYIAMPILVMIARRFGVEKAVALAAGVTLGWRFVINGLIGGKLGWQGLSAGTDFVLSHSLPGRWFEFALGMLAAALVSSQRNIFPRVVAAGLSAIILGVAAVVKDHFGVFSPLSDPLFGLGFFFLILFVANPGPTPWMLESLGSIFRKDWLVKLGVISYSIYLVHVPVLDFVLTRAHVTNSRSSVIFMISFAVAFPVILIVAILFYRCIERPTITAGRKHTASKPECHAAELPAVEVGTS